MNCLRCGKEIDKKRHLCDECKKHISEKEKKKLLFSPNNKDVKYNFFIQKAILLTVACIIIAAAICVLLGYLL